jgi:hypothetical protein
MFARPQGLGLRRCVKTTKAIPVSSGSAPTDPHNVTMGNLGGDARSLSNWKLLREIAVAQETAPQTSVAEGRVKTTSVYSAFPGTGENRERSGSAYWLVI